MVMKQIAILILTGLFLGGCSPKASSQYETVKLQQDNLEQVIEAMTLQRKHLLFVGGGMTGSSIGAAGIIRALPAWEYLPWNFLTDRPGCV